MKDIARDLGVSYVGVDDQAAGEMAAGHLLAQGCRRVAHLRGPNVSPGLGRLRGREAALTQRGLAAQPEFIVDAGATDSAGYDSMRRLLRLNPMPDGVFAFNDPVAAGAVK
ncbi:MAG: substrate-binding domain-containing protein, partial [Bryobacteraceae bacterium]